MTQTQALMVRAEKAQRKAWDVFSAAAPIAALGIGGIGKKIWLLIRFEYQPDRGVLRKLPVEIDHFPVEIEVIGRVEAQQRRGKKRYVPRGTDLA